MSNPLRIECPECGTSYKVAEGAKTGPQDKVILPCHCGTWLEATFTSKPETTRRTWYGKKVVVEGEKVVNVRANPVGDR